MTCPTGVQLLRTDGSAATSVDWGDTVVVAAQGSGFGIRTPLSQASVRCRGAVIPIAALIVQWPSPPNQRILIRIPDAVLGAVLTCGSGGYELVVKWSLTEECALPLAGLVSVIPTPNPLIAASANPRI